MPKKMTTPKASKASKASKKKTVSAQNSYLQLRQQIESMKELHAIVLVVMVVLVASLLTLLAKQKWEIKRLQFQVGFLEQRYAIWHDRAMKDIEAKQAGEAVATPTPQP